MTELLNALNDRQREAVTYCDGPELVIAGAGSGKTRVLTYKIAYLLESGYQPWNILALTFTNKAAREMKERIGRLVGQQKARQLVMGTFHSVFAHILRVEAASIGYDSNYTIYDETDSRSLIKSIVKGLGLDDKTYKPATVHSRISMSKNHLITADGYAQDHSALERDMHDRMPEMARIYAEYQQRLRQANAMDFDDLLTNTFMLFNAHDDIRRKYAARFRYVLVDEYQDTNAVQQKIVLQLAAEHGRLCVVGDDNQSIYSFRGANIDNILDFQHVLDNVKLVKLERNYRSTQNIVAAANSLILHNNRQIKKHVYSQEAEGDKVTYKHLHSGQEEAIVVCRDIKRIMKKEGLTYNDFAILYRTNAQSRTFEEEMRKPAVNIPYKIYGGLSFYQRKEIKDIIAYLRLLANPDDEEAFRRIINYPQRGIGATTLQKIIDTAARNGVSLWHVISHMADVQLPVSKGTAAKIAAFRDMMQGFRQKMGSADVFSLTKQMLKETGITADIYMGTDPDDKARQENVEELLDAMSDFVQMQREEDNADNVFVTDYLQQVALMTDMDSDNTSDDNVTLMTIHAAKGLEFPVVFVVGMEENIFPSSMVGNSMRALEEERRLLYVAMTRAEKHCILTSAEMRTRYGKQEFNPESRFIADIDPALLNIDQAWRTASSAPTQRKPWQDADYEPNKAYTGSRTWGQDYRKLNPRLQNSRPVASQFMADLKPKITAPKRPEAAVDPLSERTKQRLLSEGGSLRRLSSAITNGGRSMGGNASATASFGNLHEGVRIEHQRFGLGTVLKLEGKGENAKATVDFDNAGRKQLLLKFARFKVVN
ncbi:MAG: UvrD-helicase domain-containing protein [Prevotella sp.]|nr:UvrD-helicase domain-containing protein [Prevotella sp.]